MTGQSDRAFRGGLRSAEREPLRPTGAPRECAGSGGGEDPRCEPPTGARGTALCSARGRGIGRCGLRELHREEPFRGVCVTGRGTPTRPHALRSVPTCTSSSTLRGLAASASYSSPLPRLPLVPPLPVRLGDDGRRDSVSSTALLSVYLKEGALSPLLCSLPCVEEEEVVRRRGLRYTVSTSTA